MDWPDIIRFQQEAQEAVLDAFEAEGLVKEVESADGGAPKRVVDKKQLVARTLATLVDVAMVIDHDDRKNKALPKNILAARILEGSAALLLKPEHERTYVEHLTVGQIEGKVWALTNPSDAGEVQKLLGNGKGGSPVLIREAVTFQSEGGPVSRQAVYLTENDKVIEDQFIVPLKNKVGIAGEKLADNLAMLSHRRPELAAKITKELDEGMKAASQRAHGRLKSLTSASASTVGS